MSLRARRSGIFLIVGLVVLCQPSTAMAADSGIIGSKVTQTATDPKSHWTPERIKLALKFVGNGR